MDSQKYPEVASQNIGGEDQPERTGKNPADVSEQLRAKVSACSESITSRGNVYGSKKKDKGRLTAKQRLFVSLVSQGNSMRDSYRKAYDTHADDGQVSIAASKLAASPKVRYLLDQTFSKQDQMILDDQVATRRYVMTELLDHAKNMKTEASKLKALELIGRAVMMFTDKVESRVEAVDTDKLKNELSSHLALLDQMPVKH